MNPSNANLDWPKKGSNSADQPAALSQVFPMRVVLRMTRNTKVGHQQAATVAQLIKAAAGIVNAQHARIPLDHGFPKHVIPDAVETGRSYLQKDSRFAFGLTFVGHDPEQMFEQLHLLTDAITEIGKRRTTNRKGLGGNFRFDRVHSVIENNSESLLPIPDHWFDLQVHAAESCDALTIRFLSPLCAELTGQYKPEHGQRPGYFDTERFPIGVLAERLFRRVGKQFGAEFSTNEINPTDIQILAPHLARLYWIKWRYGLESQIQSGTNNKQSNHHHKNHRWGKNTSLFGLMGRLRVRVRSTDLLKALVMGQYIHVGEKTNFGLGRYAIEEVQSALPPKLPPFLRAQRAIDLADLAFEQPVLEQEAHRLYVPMGRVRREIKEISSQTFHPRPVEKFLLPGDKTRLIAVPDRPERVLQKAIYEQLYPVLDLFLSDSCIAYRRGLGRHNAANRIQQAFQQGFRWALRADFHHFFDSVDHQLLEDKLEVFVQDQVMIDLLMAWVKSGAPQKGRGLPTGAVISPLLANLFLREFDEAVRADGGRLVRYADDFVLLFRDPAQGTTVLRRAQEIAEQLRLHLNDEKTRLVDLEKTPFDFLGYRFFSEKGWQFRGDGLKQIEDMKWHDAPKTRKTATRHNLPGEQGLEPSVRGSWIVGPQIDWIGTEKDELVCRSHVDGQEYRFKRSRSAELIVLGSATFDHTLFRHRDEDSLQVIVADDIGRWTCVLTDSPPTELASLVLAQAHVAQDDARRLVLGRRIIAAKLRNHATLARNYPARGTNAGLSDRLRDFAVQADSADDLPQLTGIEGAGAAAWYGEFSKRIHHKFSFLRRVHPNATDPVNVMLNITQTLLHRLIALTLVREGFAPSIGFLHQPGASHAALASDLQEVFRHLMDRVVIEATFEFSPGEFHEIDRPPYLRIEPGTYRTLIAGAFKMLSTSCIMKSQQAPRSYRQHMATLARSLHGHLLNPDAHFKVFEYLL